MKLKTILLVILLANLSLSHAIDIRIAVEDWNISYPPNNEVSIIIHDTENVGLNINLVFWRGNLPADQIVYDKRNKRLKVYYSISDFRNVQEMLNTELNLSYVYSTDEGFGEAAYLSSL